MAGLPGKRAIVGVGPPLEASGASPGLATLVRSEAVKPVAPAGLPIRLLPSETKVP